MCVADDEIPVEMLNAGPAEDAELIWHEEPERKVLSIKDGAPVEPAMLSTFDAGDWKDVPVPPREFMVEGWEPRGHATYLTGVGAGGKSLLVQQRMTCSAAGLPFLGLPTRAGVSIYITCEDSLDELHRRQEAINAALGISWDHLRGRLFLVSLAGEMNKEFCTFSADGRMSVTDRWRSTELTVRTLGAEHLALDNVAHLFTGNENIRNQVAAFVGMIDGLAKQMNGSVLLLGHPNKAGMEYSGSTAWENQVRARIFLAPDEEADGSPGDPDARTLSNSKPNYSRRGESIRFLWVKWAFLLPDQIPANSDREQSLNAQANMENERFLKCLDLLNKQRRNVSHHPNASNFAPKAMAKMTEAAGLKKEGFERAFERLFSREVIAVGTLWKDRQRHDVTTLVRTGQSL